MKQASKQPMFKPLINAENTNMFNFEPQLAAPKSSSTVSFLKQYAHANVGQESGPERLSTLHAKLHGEADKIRKWKVQTEIELKQKDKKITEVSSTNDCLRKSILELQLQNENLSLRLHEEIGNQNEIVERIGSTRQLCNILKDHAVSLEDRLQQCETERTELKYMEKEYQHLFEELSSKFQKLEVTSSEEYNSITKQLQSERDHQKKAENQLTSQIQTLEEQLKKLLDQSDDNAIEIRNLMTQVQRNDEQIHVLEQTNISCKESSAKLTIDLMEKDTQIVTKDEDLLNIQEVKSKLVDEVDRLNSNLGELHEANSEYDQQVSVQKNQIDELNAHAVAATDRISAYEEEISELSSTLATLNGSRDDLLMGKTELEGKICSLKKDVDDGISNYEDEFRISAGLREQLEELQVDLSQSQIVTKNLQMSIEIEQVLKTQQTEEINGLNEKIFDLETTLCNGKEALLLVQTFNAAKDQEIKRLTTESDTIKESLDRERDNLAEERKAKCDLENCQTALEGELSAQKNDNQQLQKDNIQLQKDIDKDKEEQELLTEQLLNNRKENEELVGKSEELQNVIDELKDEQEKQSNSLDKEVKSKSKQVSDLEDKYKELKGDMTAKNKHVKELDKEIKGLKSKLTSQVKATEAKSAVCEKSDEQVIQLQEEIQKNGAQIQGFKKDAQAAKSVEKEAIKKMEKMEKKQKEAVTDKNDMEAKCEYDMAEMMATMERYKQKNNLIVDQKEKELDLLKSKTEQFDSDLKDKDCRYDELVQDNADIKTALEKESKEKLALLKKLNEQDNSVSKMEHHVKKKDMEMTSLQESLKALELTVQKKLTSTVETQTDNITITAEPSTPKVVCPKILSPQLDNSPASVTVSPMVDESLAKMTKSPQINYNSTPKIDDSTLTYSVKTPQRSILRNTKSISKRRKVVFTSNDPFASSDSDSASSVMEIALESMEARLKSKKSTPLLIRPSPKVVQSPRTPRSESSPKQTFSRSRRGPLLTSTSKKQVLSTPIDESSYLDLFPDRSKNKENREKENIRHSSNTDKTDTTPHVRKTPSKFFKSIKERTAVKERTFGKERSTVKKVKTKQQEETFWFDVDSVFGFGNED